MLEPQRWETPANQRGPLLNRGNILVACVVFAIWLGIEAVVFLVNYFIHLLVLPVAFTELLIAILLLFNIAVAFFYTWRTAQPRAIRKYIGVVRKEQEQYRSVYTLLSAIPDVYKTSFISASDPQNSQAADILQLIDQRTHRLILGLPGAGKTTALRVYQHQALERQGELVRGSEKIPIFIPMKDYNLFLRDHQQALADAPIGTDQIITMRNYLLYESELIGIHHLRPYLARLIEHGRVMFLCDGLNEVDSKHLGALCAELRQLMRDSGNLVVMTCRELDYHEQQRVFGELVGDEYATEVLITPLRDEQIADFIKKYVDEQREKWRYEPSEIFDYIKKTRLRYECNNPLMLFTLMQTINGIQDRNRMNIDTRGKLLRVFVLQLIERELEKPKWKRATFTVEDVRTFLSQVACTARRARCRNGILLGGVHGSSARRNRSYRDFAAYLYDWLIEPGIEDFQVVPEGVDPSQLPNSPAHEIAKLLEFAVDAALIDINQNAVLSFRHEVVAEYFVAEYLFEMDELAQHQALPFEAELVATVGDWNEPIGIWAGFLERPLKLASRLADVGLNDFTYGYNALTLSLMCVGVVWMPPQEQAYANYELPTSVIELLGYFVNDEERRNELAASFMQSANEGGVAIYRSLLHMLQYRGIDKLLLKLDPMVVPGLLFDYLSDVVDKDAYAREAKRIVRILGQFGSTVIAQATELSQPASRANGMALTRQTRLRKAAIEILGRTREPGAVEPLIPYLGESEEVRNEAVNALNRLGPRLALERVLKELNGASSQTPNDDIRWAILAVFDGFLKTLQEWHAQKTLITAHFQRMHQRIIDALFPLLASTYKEPIRQQAKALLLREAQATGDISTNRWEQVMELMIQHLESEDSTMVLNLQEMLRQIGPTATPLLLHYLNQQRSSETLRARIVDVLSMVRDARALRHLLPLVATAAPFLQDKVAAALKNYAPESIPLLIDQVLSTNESDAVALRAANILKEIGRACVAEVTKRLPQIVPGRTQMLVHVLEETRDDQAIPALIALLHLSRLDTMLAVVVIEALGQFPDKTVVQALLDVLASCGQPLYDEASKSLSLLGGIATESLMAALDIPQDIATTAGVRNALLNMKDFPDGRLLAAIEQCSDAQAKQIMVVFQMRGEQAAPFLVNNLCHSNKRISHYVRQTMHLMEAYQIVPALLHSLDHPTCRRVIAIYLRKHANASIPPLVNLLSHSRISVREAATTTLVEFGPTLIATLAALVPALNEQNSSAQKHAQDILVRLVQAQVEALPQVVGLFKVISLPAEQRAYDALVYVLTTPLAEASISVLLAGLSSEYERVRQGVIDALVRLVRKEEPYSDNVLDLLVKALSEEGRNGAAIALEQIGEKAVDSVHAQILHADKDVRRAARNILSNIGAPALLSIYNDMNSGDPEKREAGEEVYRNMKMGVIKDDLVKLLARDDLQDVKKVLAFFLDRVRYDLQELHTDQRVIPALLEHLLDHSRDPANLRIITFLLMLPKRLVLQEIVQVLLKEHKPQQWFAPAFLLLGMEGEEAKVALRHLEHTSKNAHGLYTEVISVLSMLDADPLVVEQASHIGQHPFTPRRTMDLSARNQLEIAQHALGGLLVSGKWNISKLQEMWHKAPDGSIERELYTVLLGDSYVPRINWLEGRLQDEKDAHTRDNEMYEGQLAEKQRRIQELDRSVTRLKDNLKDKDAELRRKTDDKRDTEGKLYDANRKYGELQSKYQELQGRYTALLAQSQRTTHLRP